MSLGFHIMDDGKHYKITCKGDPRYMATIGKTPSDNRAGSNNVGMINKIMIQRKFSRKMIYTVKRIDKDLDFGCEERVEDAPVMVIVTLMGSSGEEIRVKAEDAMLYERNINEGDKVYFDEENKLEKALGENWTKNYTKN